MIRSCSADPVNLDLQVIWSHPLFFSILVLHLPHAFVNTAMVFSDASLNFPCIFIRPVYCSQVSPSWNSRSQRVHTLYLQAVQIKIVPPSASWMCPSSHPAGFKHHRKSGRALSVALVARISHRAYMVLVAWLWMSFGCRD
jgi:hypothetical protein